ncbi:MAG: hypothetical protein R3B72_22010 [Polyangiaceae bacterium]
MTMPFASRRSFALLLAPLAVAAAFIGAPEAEAADAPVALDDSPPFTISVTNAKGKVGESLTIGVTIAAADGYKCNDSYPHKVRNLSADDGVELEETAKGKVEDKAIVIPVTVKPTKAGTFKVSGEIKFSVCNDQQCVIKKAPLEAKVTAK